VLPFAFSPGAGLETLIERRRRGKRQHPPRCRAARGLALAAAAAALLSACIQDDGRRFNPFSAVVPSISDDDEREIGMQFDRELQEVVPVIHDPVVTDFINELGQALVSQIEPQPFIYRFRVIDDPALNAFAVPGGYIYFHSGTILAVSSVDELAGVMGHEIAHIKQHHYARMRKQSQIPDLLVGIAGMAAAIAAEEPGILIASQAANVAMKLRYSREYEAEADQFGSVFMVRAGYDPAGSTRFFERILEERKRYPDNIPPYLYSHPEVEDRIASIEIAAETLQPTKHPDPDFEKVLPVVQARLAMLVDTNRSSLPRYTPPVDRVMTDPALEEALALASVGDRDEALLRLGQAQARSPDDPRIPFHVGELLFEAGRYEEAAAAYRRTLRLDASRGRVFFKLGLAYKEMGERHRAVFALEQAARRAGDASTLRRRADWEVLKLTFTIIPEAGFADGSEDEHGDTPVGLAREEFREGERRIAWWARVHPRFQSYVETFALRWTAPDGRVVQEEGVDEYSRSSIGSILELEEGATAGEWTAELLLGEEVLDRRKVAVLAH
jgi:predicted Zn-dependent protease